MNVRFFILDSQVGDSTNEEHEEIVKAGDFGVAEGETDSDGRDCKLTRERHFLYLHKRKGGESKWRSEKESLRRWHRR